MVKPFTFLWCLAIDNKFKTLLEPFQLCAPLEDECDILFVLLRISFSSLRGETEFSLLKPRTSISSDQLLPGTKLTGAQVNPRALVQRSASVADLFPVVFQNKPGSINVIIYLSDTTTGAYYLILPNNFLTLSHSERISTAAFAAHKTWRHPSRHNKIKTRGRY